MSKLLKQKLQETTDLNREDIYVTLCVYNVIICFHIFQSDVHVLTVQAVKAVKLYRSHQRVSLKGVANDNHGTKC